MVEQFYSLSRVAHRGGSLLAPENTLAAFRQALTLPVDAVECDVQMTCDGHAVVFHDNTVERLTEGTGNILDLSLSDLYSLDAATHFPGGWPQREIIPTLHEVLALLRGRKQVYIEVKNSKRDNIYGCYPRIAETIVEEVRASGMYEQVLVISFDRQILADIKSLAPELSLGIIVGREWWLTQSPELVLTTLLEQATALPCQWVSMDYRLFTPEILLQYPLTDRKHEGNLTPSPKPPDLGDSSGTMPRMSNVFALEAIHESGLKLGLWTVNTLEELQYLAVAGVDALTTDRPDLFAQLM